ncbi:hypothetical protein NOCARDAX2BIS_220166 [Nocardioides sp. AX2bis]|nr:hypothetical protein NOCARDAX2BIS_220166 [Nocardioides sp. AX2bis]
MLDMCDFEPLGPKRRLAICLNDRAY